ncbi:MAG: 5-(carboxyamino)imidazole ribonucleotide synthase [Planctomycetes bacterium]|nr:5-(carboxyamino)imidazole ribonucleotide synthase [Planctomycetota bacterium]
MITAVLGGGQLARMLALAGAPLGLRTRCLDPSPDAVAGHVAELLVGAYDDPALLQRLADGAAVCTFEFENVPVATTEWLMGHSTVLPHPRALGVGQDRLHEKTLFRELGIGTAPFAIAATRDELRQAVATVGTPCIVKTRRLGYDGKGQVRLAAGADQAAIDAAFATLTAGGYAHALIAEGFVRFDRELSVLAARGRDGRVVTWPLVQNEHEHGILARSRAPAPQLEPRLQREADLFAAALLEHLDYVGVLAVELFEVGGKLLANEMAPRVHNSGHWTIEGSVCSQFEQHLRCVHGLPLGDTGMAGSGYATMVNLIGEMPDRARLLALPGVHLHDYGKSPRAGRKLGHATVVAASRDEADALAARVRG